MLRITVQDSLQSVALKLEGQLTGPEVEEMERVWKTCDGPVAVVDLCGVTWVDGRGTNLLARMLQGRSQPRGLYAHDDLHHRRLDEKDQEREVQ